MATMTATSSLAKDLKSYKPKQVTTTEVTEGDHGRVVDLVKGRTMEVSFTVHGLPKTRKIGGKLADKVATSVQGRRKGIRSSWGMFASEHPAVKGLASAIRDVNKLRDDWTIVKSAEVRTGGDDKVTIEGGKRLIWDKDVNEFYALFCAKAKVVDLAVARLQEALDRETEDADGNAIRSVKAMDRDNAGEAWDESAYPKDLTLTVGVAKDRDAEGNLKLDAAGEPVYVINFSEYHVSEKLAGVLRERAVERLDAALSGTIETAMTYTVGELTEQMMTFLSELSNRTKLAPIKEYDYLTEYGEAEVVKMVTAADDQKVPAGHVKALVRYKEKDGDGERKVSKWLGPMREPEFHAKFRPQTTGEKKKIFPSVIEGLISQLQVFRDKKAQMLGVYGSNVVASFEPLLDVLTKAKQHNPLISNDTAARKLADALRSEEQVRQLVAKTVADAVESLEDQVTVARTGARRRTLKKSLLSTQGDD